MDIRYLACECHSLRALQRRVHVYLSWSKWSRRWYMPVSRRIRQLLHPYKHDPRCWKHYGPMDKAYRRWLKKWPHACPRCAGTGTIYFPGNWDEPPSLEACSLCTEEGKCPRCGKVVEAWLDGDEIKVCPHCGWDMADEKTHGPQPPECLCHEFIEEPEYEPAR